MASGSALLKEAVLWSLSRGMRPPHEKLDRVGELFFLKKLLISLGIDCVLDVGANRGQFASELRGIGFSGLILSFEPVSSEFEALTSRFKDDPKWRGYAFALGSKPERRLISIPKLTVLSSLLEPIGSDAYRTEEIEVKRLDSIAEEILPPGSRAFLKMDTQGFDTEVFKGAQGCLDSIHGLQSELSIVPLYKNMPHYIEALRAYEDAGYLLYNLSVVNRVDDGSLLELNCYMRKRTERQGI